MTTDPFSYTEEGQPLGQHPLALRVGHAASQAAYDWRRSTGDPTGATAGTTRSAAGALVALDALVRMLTALVLLGIRRAGPGALVVGRLRGAGPGRRSAAPAGVVLGGLAGRAEVAPETWGLLLLAARTGSSCTGRSAWAAAARGLRPDPPVPGLGQRRRVVPGRPGRPGGDGAREPRPVPGRGGVGAVPPRHGLAVLGACAAVCLIEPVLRTGSIRAACPPSGTCCQGAGQTLTHDQLSFFGQESRRSSRPIADGLSLELSLPRGLLRSDRGGGPRLLRPEPEAVLAGPVPDLCGRGDPLGSPAAAQRRVRRRLGGHAGPERPGVVSGPLRRRGPAGAGLGRLVGGGPGGHDPRGLPGDRQGADRLRHPVRARLRSASASDPTSSPSRRPTTSRRRRSAGRS